MALITLVLILMSASSYSKVEGLWVLNPHTNKFELRNSEDNSEVITDRLDEEVGVPFEHQKCGDFRRSLKNENGTVLYGCTSV